MEQTTARETRDRVLVVRLTDAEYADLAERARLDDRSVSSYVRRILGGANHQDR